MRHLKTVLTVLGAVTVLVLASNTVVIAATGQGFILGKSNSANNITALTRTTAGSALKLTNQSPASAPFLTNGTGKVTNLNADRLDSLDSTQLTTNTKVYTDSDFDTVHNTQSYWHFDVAPGDYTITYSVGVSPQTPDATVLCGFINSPDTYAWESDQVANGYNGAWLSGTATKRFTEAQTVHFFCNSSASAWTLESEMALQITVTRINKVTETAALPGYSDVPGRQAPKQGH